jgi:GTPase SAR1 family protein
MIRGFLSLVGIETDRDPQTDSSVTHRTDAPKICTIPMDLQTSFAQRGVRQNIKVVLRGERRVGKTALMHRLQGKLIPATYAPSQAISATTVRWQMSEEEVTKVEVWDVVDNGSVAKVGCSSTERELRFASHPHMSQLLPTDATTVDVYRNCNAAIFMLDVTRSETLDYVARETKKVPPHIPICVLANFFDQENHVVRREMLEQVRDSIAPAMTPFVRSITGPPRRGQSFQSSPCAPATVIELSLATGYGMSVLHSYLSVPFSFAKAMQAEEAVQASFEALQKVYHAVNGMCAEQSFAKFMVNLRQREAETARTTSAEVCVEDVKSGDHHDDDDDDDRATGRKCGRFSVGSRRPESHFPPPHHVIPVSKPNLKSVVKLSSTADPPAHGVSSEPRPPPGAANSILTAVHDTNLEALDKFFGSVKEDPPSPRNGDVLEPGRGLDRPAPILRQLSQPWRH